MVIFNLFISLGFLIGSGKTGPYLSNIKTSYPIALGITKISEKMIEASNLYLSIGYKVTSHAKNGLSQISKNWKYFLTSLNSGKYLPAYLIIQQGKWSNLAPF